jgi:hypothetical protein
MNKLPRPVQTLLMLALLGAIVYFGAQFAGKTSKRIAV